MPLGQGKPRTGSEVEEKLEHAKDGPTNPYGELFGGAICAGIVSCVAIVAAWERWEPKPAVRPVEVPRHVHVMDNEERHRFLLGRV